MKRRSAVLFCCLVLVGFSRCSGPKEEIKELKPEAKHEEPRLPEKPRVFNFEDRYYVRGASLDNPTNIDDPLQASRVIQIKEGPNQVLVVNSFNPDYVNGQKVNVETWFGIELPSFAPGTYQVADAVTAQFYRFYLGEHSRSLVGKRYSGSVTIEGLSDGYLIGSLSVTVSGITRSFEEKAGQVELSLTGSFRIKEVPLEATVVGKK